MAKLMEALFILDRSGSMSGSESDIIGGFNSMIEQQKENDCKTYVSTILFDDKSEVLHDRLSLKEIKPLSKKDYYVRGCTALLDASADAIKHIKNVHKYARPEDRPDKTLVVIMTDGYENSSNHTTNEQLKEIVKEQEAAGWEFVFIGAEIDAFSAASDIGIKGTRSIEMGKEGHAFEACFGAISDLMISVSKCEKSECVCDESIEKAFSSVKKKR